MNQKRKGGLASDPLVLMGFADAMAAIETAWSLQDAGFRVAAFRRSGTKPAVRHVRGIELYDVPAPEIDAFGSVASVRQLCERLAPAALLPLDDHAVWVCSQQEDSVVPLAGAYGTAAEYALDKSLQLQAAAKAGIPVPETQASRQWRGTLRSYGYSRRHRVECSPASTHDKSAGLGILRVQVGTSGGGPTRGE
jgi:hypothetical protein